MPTVKIDNKDYEVDSAVKSRIDALESKESELSTVKSDRDSIQGKLDAKETEVKQLNDKLNEAKKAQPTQDAMQKAVDERLSLIDTARTFLGDEYEFKDKADRDIKVAVIQTADSEFKADDKSDDYINARYDGTVSVLRNSGFQSTGDNQMKFSGDDSTGIEKKRQDRLNLRNTK